MDLHLNEHRKSSTKHENFLNSYILVKEGTVNSNVRIGKGRSEPLMKLIKMESI